jgi:hypothetical protein
MMAMERLTFMDNIRTIFPLETALGIWQTNKGTIFDR